MSVFEGSEKRLEVEFALSENVPKGGLRNLRRDQLDELLDLAACKIISGKSNSKFDGYVLSESSLFVYPTSYVLKTCGTTKLLNSVPELLRMAGDLGMVPVQVRFSRASFLFPEDQPAPHSSFQEEVSLLKKYFGSLGHGGHAYVLGDQCNGLQWHVFAANSKAKESGMDTQSSTMSLEMCMTGLSRKSAANFFRSKSFVSAEHTTRVSGIADLLPGADIDDFVFEPCGYSMNGLLGAGFLTIHVTPEAECSYASIEFSGFNKHEIKVDHLVNLAVKIFAPENLYVTATLAGKPSMADKSGDCWPLEMYVCNGMSTQKLPTGDKVVFGHFSMENAVGYVEEGLKQSGSMSSLQSELSDLDYEPEMKKLRTDGVRDKALDLLREQYAVADIVDGSAQCIDNYIRKEIVERGLEDTFYVLDLSVVARLYRAWCEEMPRVEPFYAVKCNPDRTMISLLGSLGAGFDCASDEEVRLVLRLGISPSKIVFANACKRPRDLRTAKKLNVGLTTFDNEAELVKLQKYYPECKLILRVRADDPNARCQLGNKFGAEMEDVIGLLESARKLQLDVVGVSFHVGSGGSNPKAFVHAIALAKRAFEAGALLGFNMRLLDIGGGFSGGHVGKNGCVNLRGVATAVNTALDKYFPANEGVKVIAEPGRYFAEASATLATYVYGYRERVDGLGELARDYWITDGLYGSFNCIPYDHATVRARALHVEGEWKGKNMKSTLFGPTCDGLDTVLKDCWLPELAMGDWVVFPDMGAYTLAGASDFNGMNATDVEVLYVWSHA